MSLTQAQKDELTRLAKAGKSGVLNDLAERWKVPFKEVARGYADAQRELNGKQPPTPKHPPIQELTPLQKKEIHRIADAGNQAKLSTLAEDWNVDSRVISRYYNDCREQLRNQVVVNPEPVTPPAPKPTTADLVADVVATPGQIAMLPRNWPLLQARLASGYTVRDIALAIGSTQPDYQRIEGGQQNPTAEQAAKLCALLKVPPETFVVTCSDPMKGSLRSLSLLGILRAKRRLAMKDLALKVSEATGYKVTSTLISAIERGQLKQPISADYAQQIDALARFFGVTCEAIMAQVPPEWIQTAGSAIAALHSTLKQAVQALPAPTVDPELLLTAGTGGDDLLE